MPGVQYGIGDRPDRTEAEENIGPDEELRRRRWRILLLALPRRRWSKYLPYWVRSPGEFIAWIASQLTVQELRAYLADCERIAKQTHDLELLRFARSDWAASRSRKGRPFGAG